MTQLSSMTRRTDDSTPQDGFALRAIHPSPRQPRTAQNLTERHFFLHVQNGATIRTMSPRNDLTDPYGESGTLFADVFVLPRP